MTSGGAPLDGSRLTLAISSAIVDPCARFYKHAMATAPTHINDIAVCVLENILTPAGDALTADGSDAEVIDCRIAFQTQTEDEFTVAIERLTHSRVVTSPSSNQTAPGAACEVFFLEALTLDAVSQEAA